MLRKACERCGGKRWHEFDCPLRTNNVSNHKVDPAYADWALRAPPLRLKMWTHRKQHDDALRARVVVLLDKGLTTAQIVARLGVSRKLIYCVRQAQLATKLVEV